MKNFIFATFIPLFVSVHAADNVKSIFSFEIKSEVEESQSMACDGHVFRKKINDKVIQECAGKGLSNCGIISEVVISHDTVSNVNILRKVPIDMFGSWIYLPIPSTSVAGETCTKKITVGKVGEGASPLPASKVCIEPSKSCGWYSISDKYGDAFYGSSNNENYIGRLSYDTSIKLEDATVYKNKFGQDSVKVRDNDGRIGYITVLATDFPISCLRFCAEVASATETKGIDNSSRNVAKPVNGDIGNSEAAKASNGISK